MPWDLIAVALAAAIAGAALGAVGALVARAHRRHWHVTVTVDTDDPG